jgi:hypothetical protein
MRGTLEVFVEFFSESGHGSIALALPFL